MKKTLILVLVFIWSTAHSAQQPVYSIPSIIDYGADPTATTSSSDAIDAALAANSAIYIPPGNYLLTRKVVADNKRIYGTNSLGANGATFTGDSTIPATSPLLSLGRSSVLENIKVGYEKGAVTGSEAQGERVCLATKGEAYQLQRGSSVNGVYFANCGTAIGDNGNGVFSVTFKDIEIGPHSYAGVDIRGIGRTGNVWSNIYIGGGDFYPGPKYGFNFEGQESGGVIDQLNVEHQTYTDAAIRFSGSNSLTASAIHIEGVDISTPDRGYLEINQSGIHIGSLAVLNTRMSRDKTYIVKLLDARYSDAASNPADYTKTNLVWIDNYHTKGLANPNYRLYPTYPSGRRGLNNISGFQHFFRPAAYTNNHYKLAVGEHNWLAYTGEADSIPYLKYAWERYSNPHKNIALKQWGAAGESITPRKNLVTNGDMKLWINESATATAGGLPIEAAKNAYISSGIGTVTATKVDSGYRQVSDSYIKVSNIGTPGAYQSVHWRITDWKKIIGEEVTVSFEAKASVAGRRLERLSIVLDNTGGTPSAQYTQIMHGSNSKLNLTTEWQYYSFTFTPDNESNITVFGLSPFYKLIFEINGEIASRESKIDIRNIKTEIGSEASQFSFD